MPIAPLPPVNAIPRERRGFRTAVAQELGRGGRQLRVATARFVDIAVFILLLSGPPQMRVRDATASLRGELDAATLIKLGVWGLGLLWLTVRLYPYLVQRGAVPRLGSPQLIAGFLFVVLGAGMLTAPGPALTAFAIYQMAVMVGFAWMFTQLFGPEAYVKYLFWGYLILAIAILAAWVFMPELVVRRGRVRGDLIGPAGSIGALGLVLCLSGVLRFRKARLALATGIFALVLAAAQTRTALAAFIITIPIGLWFRYPAPIKRAVPVAVVAVLVAGLFDVLSVGQQYALREQQSLATLSDRIPLWDHLLSTMLRESPVIGLGFYSASRVLGPQYNPGLGNAHSAFVEVLVGGGLLGGALFFLLYGVLITYAVKLLIVGRDDPLAFAVLGLFAVTFVMSTTITDGIQSGPVGFTFWSVTALLPAVLYTRRHAERPPVRSGPGYVPRT